MAIRPARPQPKPLSALGSLLGVRLASVLSPRTHPLFPRTHPRKVIFTERSGVRHRSHARLARGDARRPVRSAARQPGPRRRVLRRRGGRGGRRGADRPGRAGPRRGHRGTGLRARRSAREAGRDRLLGVREPVEPAAAHRRDRDQRQDHLDLPAGVRAARGRPPDRADRRGGDQDRPGPAAQYPDHPGGARPAGPVRGHGRARRDRRRDGGVQPLAGPRPGRGHELRRGGVHQPVAGSPGLPRRPGGLLPGQGLPVHASRTFSGGLGPPPQAARAAGSSPRVSTLSGW